MGSTKKLYDNEGYEINRKALAALLKKKGGIDSNDAFMLLMLSQLTRASDALEEISSHLSVICDCVEKPEPFIGSRLRIKR